MLQRRLLSDMITFKKQARGYNDNMMINAPSLFLFVPDNQRGPKQTTMKFGISLFA